MQHGTCSIPACCCGARDVLSTPSTLTTAGSAGHIAGIEAASTSLAQLARSVQAVAPEPCFALMVAFREALPGVPFDSASVAAGATGSGSSSSSSSSASSSAAFQWVACNSSKPGRPQPAAGAPQCWVALTTAQRARQILERRPLSTADGRFNPQTEQYRAEVAAELLADFRGLMQPFVQLRVGVDWRFLLAGVGGAPLVAITCVAARLEPAVQACCASHTKASARSTLSEQLHNHPRIPPCSPFL